MIVPDITSTPTGKRLTEIMGKGLLDYCVTMEMEFPNSYEGFEEILVEVSRGMKLEGALAFFSPRAQKEFMDLIGIDSSLFSNLREAIEKSDGEPELERKLFLAKLLGTDPRVTNKERAIGIRIFGPEYEPIAKSFEVGFCQRKAVFEAALTLIKDGYVPLDFK